MRSRRWSACSRFRARQQQPHRLRRPIRRAPPARRTAPPGTTLPPSLSRGRGSARSERPTAARRDDHDRHAAQPVTCTWSNSDGSRSTQRQRPSRRHAALGLRGTRSRRRQQRLVQPRLHGRVHGGRRPLRARLVLAARPYGGPDTGPAAISGSCTDVAGNSRAVSFGFQFDATPPSVVASPTASRTERAGTTAGSGSSSSARTRLSGVSSCAPDAVYGGPDARRTAVAGTCTDRAANTSAGRRVRAELRRAGAEPREGPGTAPPQRDRAQLGRVEGRESVHARSQAGTEGSSARRSSTRAPCSGSSTTE